MSIESQHTQRPTAPTYPQRSRVEKAAMAVTAVLLSSTLLGGVLSLFEVRGANAAMAAASVAPGPSTGAVARRTIDPGPRG